MAKKVKVILKNDGKSIGVSFAGYQGDSCFDEADKIKARLKALGIEMEVLEVELTSENSSTTVGAKKTVKVTE